MSERPLPAAERTDASASASPIPATIKLPLEAMRALRRAIADAAGSSAAADEVLFRVGCAWGEHEALASDGSGLDARERFTRGAQRMAATGLGLATVETVRVDPLAAECLATGRVLDSVEQRLRADSQLAPEGPVCGITVGYLAGMLAGISGMDIVSKPFHCSPTCESPGCRFELRPAHELPAADASLHAPSGSARFFLGSMGASMGGGDIALDDLVEHTTDAVLLIDASNVIRYWNKGAEAMFLYARAETVGKPIGFLLPPDLLASDELGKLQRAIDRDGSLSNYVTRRVRKDGIERWVSLTRSALHDSLGRVIGSTAVFRDITEQRQTEAELSRSRELAMIGELAAQVAHQIKNPLAGMHASIQLLARRPGTSRDDRAAFEDIMSEIRRLDDTVKSLLRFSRPASPRRARVELAEYLADVVDALLRRPEIERCSIATNVPAGLYVSIDPALMLEVFENLLQNAAQAMDGAGRIEVRALADEREVVIEVVDEGPGIPADLVDSIFAPFFTTKGSGNGLGLSIAKKNVEAHAGSIVARSGPRGGAIFRIRLPRLSS